MRNRYPGSIPFTVEYKDLFFGRDEDIKELCLLVNVENLSVLYGKSGLGKSSLLNAGALPQLETENDYLPLEVRFNNYVEGNPQKPVGIFIQKITEDRQPESFLNKIHEYVSFWQYLKSIQFQNQDKKYILLILDQFEEIFTYPEGVEDFTRQLAELLNNKMPRSFQRNLRRKLDADPELLTDDEWDFY